MSYLKNSPSPTRLQRLPCWKQSARAPPCDPLFWQSKLLCFTTQVTLPFKVSYFQAQNSLSLDPKIASFCLWSRLAEFAQMANFCYHLNKGAVAWMGVIGAFEKQCFWPVKALLLTNKPLLLQGQNHCFWKAFKYNPNVMHGWNLDRRHRLAVLSGCIIGCIQTC